MQLRKAIVQFAFFSMPFTLCLEATQNSPPTRGMILELKAASVAQESNPPTSTDAEIEPYQQPFEAEPVPSQSPMDPDSLGNEPKETPDAMNTEVQPPPQSTSPDFVQTPNQPILEPENTEPPRYPEEESQTSISLDESMYQAEPTQAIEENTGPIMDCEPICCYEYDGRAKRWMADLEFLYWKVNKGNAWYCMRRNGPPFFASGGSFTGDFLGEVRRPTTDFEPGVRGGISYRFDRDCWELGAFYTYYHTSKTHTSSVVFPPAIGVPDDQEPTSPTIVPSWPYQLHGNPNTAVSKISYTYMIEDLRLLRLFQLTPYIDLSLFFGLQGAEIWQRWHTSFSFQNPVTPGDVIFAGIEDKVKLDWSFKGLGGNLGFDTTWYLYDRLGLFAKASFSALYGFHKTRLLNQSNEQNFPAADLFEDISNTTINDHRPIYGTQYAFGLSWDREFCSVNFKLSASYESITWNNLNGDVFTASYPTSNFQNSANSQHPPIIDDTPFNLSGLTLRAILEF